MGPQPESFAEVQQDTDPRPETLAEMKTRCELPAYAYQEQRHAAARNHSQLTQEEERVHLLSHGSSEEQAAGEIARQRRSERMIQLHRVDCLLVKQILDRKWDDLVRKAQCTGGTIHVHDD